mgnify:CR=1 FL=1
MLQSSWTGSKNNDLLVHERAGPGLPVGARGQARSSNEVFDIPIAQSLTSSVMIQSNVISDVFAPEFAESHIWQTKQTHDAVQAVKQEAQAMHQLVVDRLMARSVWDITRTSFIS